MDVFRRILVIMAGNVFVSVPERFALRDGRLKGFRGVPRNPEAVSTLPHEEEHPGHREYGNHSADTGEQDDVATGIVLVA